MKFDEAKWQKVVKDKDFIETYKDAEKDEKKDKPDYGDVKAPSVDLGAARYVFYIIIAGAILFLIIKILQNLYTTPVLDTGTGKTYTIEEVEEKMMEIDLDHVLKEAIAARDFRMALRVHFLIIIKTLALNGRIDWAKEKTNWEYLNEIKDMLVAHKFRIIVVSFESIWYGEHELNEKQFNELQSSYELFKSGITK